MQELSFTTLIAVLEEVFGRGLFRTMLVLMALVTALFLFVLIRDRAISWRKFLLAQIAMPFGAVGAVLFVQKVTSSGFGDLGGPIDVIALAGVAIMGALGAAILVYTAQALLRGRVGRAAISAPGAAGRPVTC